MGDVDLMRQFSRRLRRLMATRGYTPKALCWAMGETPDKAGKVLAWLNGERLPSYSSLVALKDALKCEWEELLG